jgi:hypothetical protein
MAAPPVFPRKEEALAMLDEEFERVGLLTPSAFTIEKQKRPGSQKLAWWHNNGPEAERGDWLRDLAYLRTYFRITGGRPLPAGGLRLHKDRVWMDKAVVSTLERDGFLAFEPTGHFEPSFVATEKGRHWIATGEVLT